MSIISTLLRFGVNVPVLAEKIYRAEEKGSVDYAECGVRSAECGKCGVWKIRSVENAECGKCGVWKMRSVETFYVIYFNVIFM